MRGLRLRSIVCLNVVAVTSSFEGGEKRSPGRITKVYTRPPSLTVGAARAASGTSCSPAAPGSSGLLSRLEQIAYSIELSSIAYATAGSKFVMSDGTLTTSVPPDGCTAIEGWTLTQTSPLATASACGLPPTSTGALGRLVRSSIRVSVPSPAFATQTLPSASAIAAGDDPTFTVVITALVAGSIDLTVPSSVSATQTASSPTAIADGSRPTGIWVIAPVASTRTTRFASRYASHELPNPCATAVAAALASTLRRT